VQIQSFLDRSHARVFRIVWLRYFASFCRLALAVGFVAPGLTKAMGYRFANPAMVTVDTPIGAFFDAFFGAGPYYTFVGFAQIGAAVLLLFDRTAAVGAVLYFPIILNIFVITAALQFGGTAVVTGLMLLACSFLLCWYYPAWKGLLFPNPDPTSISATPAAPRPIRIAWWLAAIGGIAIACTTRGILRYPVVWYGALLLLGLAIVLCAWAAFRPARGSRPERRLTFAAGDVGPA
jgi:hypothetical protein